MHQIRVAIHHRGDPYRYARVDGQFAYPVDGLDWQQFALSKKKPASLAELSILGFDVAWLDEGKYKNYKLFAPAVGDRRTIPVVYWSLYPTLNESTFETRVIRAQEQADLVLLDHDDLGRWKAQVDCPVRRLAYATNERYYRDRGLVRDIDVGFYCVYAYNSERPALDEWLAGFCKRKNWVYGTTQGKNVGAEYAELLARTKVIVHMNRTSQTRPPRIFDTAASGAALLSNPLPRVSGEHFEPWVHYAPFSRPVSSVYEPWTKWKPLTDDDCSDVARGLEWLIDERHWERVAQQAKAYVLACHTWEQRAKELRGILMDVFPGIKERASK